MANMSYCRFRNTRGDLHDCKEAIENILDGGSEEDGTPIRLHSEEMDAAVSLVEHCREIVMRFLEEAGMDEAADQVDKLTADQIQSVLIDRTMPEDD